MVLKISSRSPLFIKKLSHSEGGMGAAVKNINVGYRSDKK
jgi:hypothetical protein